MTFYYPMLQQDMEPNAGNIRQWMDNIKVRFMPVEQCRWNESNIDTLFYAGYQTFVNQGYNLSSTANYGQYYFNLVQQPVNMITGYERQHRKNFLYVPTEGADPTTTDQYTKLMTHVANAGAIHEQKSKAKELAAVAAMCLAQPYLDYTADPAQGELKVKIWEYNSFLVDPYFRSPDMSDAQFIWCQEYISRYEAEERFPGKNISLSPLVGTDQCYGNFYFLPENHNMAQNDLLVVSYIWYKWKRKKKRLYSRKRNQFFDIAPTADLDSILYNIPDMEIVNVTVPTWKLATVLNDQLMYQGNNPMGFDSCPMIPYFWNYDPHINHSNLRTRSLIRPMRSPQFLFNHKVITNNDVASAVINSGYKRMSGAVANEDNLKKSQAGFDIIINEGYAMTDVEKIVPTAIPESDLALAQQMSDLIYQVSGINLEDWSGQSNKQISSLTMLLKQAANLMVFQKYFDQWDFSDKLLGDVSLQIILNKWNAAKVSLYIGEEPSPHFYSKIFSKYQIIVEESDLTPTQQNLQAQQMMDMNQAFGREVFSPSMIIPKLNITGKGQIVPYLQQQEEQAAAIQKETQNISHAFEEAKLKELISKAALNIASAQERYGRKDSNIGLFEERLSEISRNRALATKDKMDALQKLLEAISKYGEIESFLKMNQLETVNMQQVQAEDREKQDARLSSFANDFQMNIMNQQQPGQQMAGTGQM